MDNYNARIPVTTFNVSVSWRRFFLLFYLPGCHGLVGGALASGWRHVATVTQFCGEYKLRSAATNPVQPSPTLGQLLTAV